MYLSPCTVFFAEYFDVVLLFFKSLIMEARILRSYIYMKVIRHLIFQCINKTNFPFTSSETECQALGQISYMSSGLML